ncbi:MAG: RNA-binding transcriptional accessory protein [Desulfarculaceae bacterium]|nr:RNA-binding transcriptional accessory protein [Desulfarculaceae bacterium]
MKIAKTISKETRLSESNVSAVIQLLEAGASIPFVARYRKERTGSMDEVAITGIRDRMEQLAALEKRKKAVLKSLSERGLLTDELAAAVRDATTMAGLEDKYEKYRPKKRTRALAAKEKGLGPLADFLLAQSSRDPVTEAESYVLPGKTPASPEEALSGARDIIAETICEDIPIRKSVRELFTRTALIHSTVKKGKEDEGQTYRDYFEWSEKAFKAPSHRILAMFRGQNEGVLSVRVLPEEEKAIEPIEKRYVKNNSASARQVRAAVTDGYKRLLSKSIEKECKNALKSRADREAIDIFAGNLKELLMEPPLGPKRILAIDPGFRTGCKMVCLDAQGTLLQHDVIFPHQGDKAARNAAETIRERVETCRIEAVAVGNGTAGRETETFIRSTGLEEHIDVIMVDESGASVYSASKTAREEFPDQDITIRGAVSIGRRLLDPLAELVKLPPESIGVGQYQHDVDHQKLSKALDDVVISCVNRVGVDAGTASRELLARVSGLNSAIAGNMVRYREEKGPFKSRREFLKVPGFGPKTFEQAAGFLRLIQSDHPLDRSGIHPESYPVVEQMAADAGTGIKELMMDAGKIEKIDLTRYVTETIGLPTLEDIAGELSRPGRDPREAFQPFSFDNTVHDMKDLLPGMKIPGIVTNVTAFGAFVDIGVHRDGLVHISRLADRYVKDPGEIVSVREKVIVTVLEVDVERKRISLSMTEEKPLNAK